MESRRTKKNSAPQNEATAAIYEEVGCDAFGDIPLMRDVGPDIPFLLWNGVLAPARTPAPIVRMLNAAVVEAAGSAEVRSALASQSTTPASNTPEAFARFIRDEQDRYAKVVRESGARAD